MKNQKFNNNFIYIVCVHILDWN